MRLSATFLLFGVVVLLITFVDCQELTSTLQTSDIYGVPVAYDGEFVTFTCVTRGSGTIAWSSEEQIGSGGRRLELISVQPIGTFVTAGTATAMLISVSDNSGSVVIMSQLQISVSSTYQTSSVTCHSVGTDTQNTTLFYMADEVSLQCDNYCPGEAVTCTCTVASSSTLSWISEEYIGRGSSLQFTSNDTVPSTLNATVPGADARLTKISSTNGVFVITSKITILSSSNNIILTCRNVGRTLSRSAIISINDDCASLATSVSFFMTTSHSINVTYPTTEIAITDLNMNSSVLAGAVAGVVTVFVIVIITVTTIILVLCRCRQNISRDNGQLSVQVKFERNTRLTLPHPDVVAEQESPKVMYYEEPVLEMCTYIGDDYNCDQQLVISHTNVAAEEESPKTIQDTMSHSPPLRPYENAVPFDECHVTPFRSFSHKSEVSPLKEATQQFSRDQDLMVFPLQEESQLLSKEQETMVSPLEEATQPFSNEQEITIRDLQSENERLRETVRCLQTENERLREKESVSETVVQEKYNKLNMVDDFIGEMEIDITLTNQKTKEAHLVAQEKSDKIDILDDVVPQLMEEMTNLKQQCPQPEDGAGAMGAMVSNDIKLKSTHYDDEDYKTFKKYKK